MAGFFKKIKKDYTLNPKKGSNKLTKFIGNLVDWKQVGEDVGNLAHNVPMFIADNAFRPVSQITGVPLSRVYEKHGIKGYRGDVGSTLQKYQDTSAKLSQAALPLALGAAGAIYGGPTGFAVGSSIGKAATSLGTGIAEKKGYGTEYSNSGSKYDYKANTNDTGVSEDSLASKPVDTGVSQPIKTGSVNQNFSYPKEYENIYQKENTMYKFKSGGLNQYRTINIEKGELLVNPKTLEILDHYNDAPKHPDGKNEIDLRGNREVPVGMAIIPAKLANEFKKASDERKREIINSLPGFSGEKLFVGVNEVPPIQPDEVDTGGLTNAQVLGGTAGAIAPSLGYGIYQTIAANRALKKLGKEPYAMYNEQTQPELQQAYGFAKGRADAAALRSRYGLSQAQQAAYNQNIARDINTRMQRAQDVGGGNVGQTVGNIMNANRIQAAQQQAALDAQLQMQKQQYADRAAQYAEGLAQRIALARQQQQNQNIAFQQQLRLMKEKAYGLAKQKGMENMMNAPMQAASILGTYYGGIA